MPKPGDRVVVEGTKVGGGRREGTLLALSGSLMRIRWEDGGETFMAPGAGAVRFITGSGKAKSSTAAKPKANTQVAKSKPKPAKAKKK